MEQYKIDYDSKLVYVTIHGEWEKSHYLPFRFLETEPPPYDSLTLDRANAYAIARDELIDKGLICPSFQYEE